MTYLPLVGYTILLRDLLAPLVEVVLDRELGDSTRNIMVSVLVVLVRLAQVGDTLQYLGRLLRELLTQARGTKPSRHHLVPYEPNLPRTPST